MRFEEHENHYFDTNTGLKWALTTTGLRTYDDAIKLPLGCKLPTVSELFYLIDYRSGKTELPNMFMNLYWAYHYENDDLTASVVDFCKRSTYHWWSRSNLCLVRYIIKED